MGNDSSFIINTDIFSDTIDRVFGRGNSHQWFTYAGATGHEGVASEPYREGSWLDFGNHLQEFIKFYKFDSLVPSYPVTNLSIDSDGTCNVEIAVCGFDKKDISVKRKGDVLEIVGEIKEDEDGNTNKPQKQYAYKKIAQRDFIIKYRVNDKFDIDRMKVSLDKGILSLQVPLKEENKPTEQTYDIN